MNYHSCNETRLSGTKVGNETRCLLCGAPLVSATTGRPPKFCSTAHRVAFHRQQHVPKKPRPALDEPKRRDRAKVLWEIEDNLEQLPRLQGATKLRQLAEKAEEVACFLDNTAEVDWALDDLPDVADALFDLRHHRKTLDALVGLDDLADELEEVARTLSALRRQREDLCWAAQNEEDESLLDMDRRTV
jgi:hypothetical protein